MKVKLNKLCKKIANYALDVFTTELNGVLEMLTFESLELIKNKYIKDSFEDYIQNNPKYGTFLDSLIGKAHSYLASLQGRLGKSSEYAQSTDENMVKEDQIIKEFSSWFLYLGRYFKAALFTVLEENEKSTFEKFEISKMLSKAVRSLNSVGETISDKSTGILYTSNNLGYLHTKLSLLDQTSFF